jgi:hypothetical protein
VADHARLVVAAMRLRSEAPDAWEGFVVALREYAAMITSDVLVAPTDQVVRSQGMAIAATRIAQTLVEAPQIYDKMQRR